MKTATKFCWMVLCAVLLAFAEGPSAKAQETEVRSRIVDAVDDTKTVRLEGMCIRSRERRAIKER